MTASEIRSAASVYSQSQIDTSLASKADLVSGVIPTSQIPAIAITEYLGSVSSQVAMLALVGDRGDWCLRSDLGTTWVLSDDDSTLLASWTQLLYPTAPVTSVAGRTGAVTLSHTDISGLGTLATQSGTFSGNSSGTNTGDQDLSSYLTSSTAASTYLPLAGGTLTGDLKFTDATYDIGKTGATRPRDGFFSRDLSVAGTAYATAYYFQNTNLRISAAAAPYTMLFYTAGNVTCQMSSVGTTLLAASTGSIGFASSSLGATTTTGDTLLFRDAAGTLAQRNSTNAQTLRVYNTYTSATSFENLQFKAVAGAAYQIGSAIGSAGGTTRAVDIGRWDSAGTWQSSLLIDPTNFLVTVGTTQTLLVKTLQLTSTGQIRGDSGNITLSDHSTATTFGLLRFGGTTSSYPAIKRNGVGLEFRLADDSAVAGITAGALTLTQAVSTSGSPTVFTITGAAHTTLTASTEATDVNFNLARTVQFATGALTTQRAVRIQAPTYGFVGASTITTASTLSISGPPVAGTNATITNAYALNVESGNSYFGGNVRAVGSSVYAPSYGFGSDNSGFFRSSTSRIFLGLNGNVLYDFNSGNLCTNSGSYGVAGGSVDSNSADVLWVRDGAGIWATRNGTNAQTFRLYNTYTSATSFENLQFKAVAGAAYQIGSAIGSAGGTNRDLNFGSWDTAGTFASSFYVGSTYAGVNDSKIFYVGTSSRIEFSALSSLGSPAIRFAWGGGSPACVYGGSNTLGVGINGFTRLLFGVSSTDFTGSPFTISNTAVATGAYNGFTFTGAAHTNQTASTEATMVNWNLAQTVQFATGALTTQRAMRIQAPTYGFVGASTITTASTLSISGPPVAGTNATITNGHALNIESGSIRVNSSSASYGGSASVLVFQSRLASPNTSLAGISIYADGTITSNGNITLLNSGAITATSFTFDGGYGGLSRGSGTLNTLGTWLSSAYNVGLVPASGYAVQIINGTNSQKFQLYNTFTSSTSYETLNIKGKASANFEIGPENGSAGGTLRGLTLGGYSAGTTTISPWLTFTSSGNASFSQYATIQGGVLVEAGGSFTTNYAAPAQIRVRRAQGTQGSPTQATNGIQLGIIGAQGLNDGGAYAGYTSYISFNAGENITTTGCGGYFNFYTTPVGSTTEAMRAWIGAAGNFGIGVFAAEPSTLLTINGDMFRLMTAKTPATSGATGNAGEFCWDTTYLYCCTATNTWKRVAWSTF